MSKWRYKNLLRDDPETPGIDCGDHFSVHDAAEEAASYEHDVRDGWEGQWPMTFVLIDEDGSAYDVVVDRESRPHFFVLSSELRYAPQP